MPLTPGDRLYDRYRIEALLTHGGMGVIYRAWDERLEVAVAIKELALQAVLPPEQLERLHEQFRQEARTLARLSHSNLVRVIDFFSHEGADYLVMGYVEGKNLTELVRAQGPLPEAQVRTWAGQLLDALAYCHRNSVYHRDVKPDNVIIDPDGRAVLVDFGLVKSSETGDQQTQTAIRGWRTPQYAPPEQSGYATTHTDQRSDLYSLGATLYHALTGTMPPEVAQRIAHPELLRPIDELAPDVSPRTVHAVSKALEMPVLDRWQSAPEMADALGITGPPDPSPVDVGALPAPLVPTIGASPPKPAGGRPAPRSTWLPWAAGALAVILVAAGGVLAWGRGWLGGRTTPTSEPVAAASSATWTATLPATSTPLQTSTGTATSLPTETATPASPSTPSPTAAESTPTVASTAAIVPTPTHTSAPPATAAPTSVITNEPTVIPTGPETTLLSRVGQERAIASRQSETARAPEVAYSPATGNYLIVFQASDGIYGQMVSRSGQAQGGRTLLSSRGSGESRASAAIVYNDRRDEFLVAWVDVAGGVFGRRVSGSGELRGHTTIHPGESNVRYCMVDLAYNPDRDEYVVVWNDTRGNLIRTYGVRLDADGIPWGAGSEISASDRPQHYAAIAYGGKRYLVVWRDWRHDTDSSDDAQIGCGARLVEEATAIYGRYLDQSGTPTGAELNLSGLSRSSQPDVAYNTRLGSYYVVWMEGQYLVGADILGRQMIGTGAGAPSTEIARISQTAQSAHWPTVIHDPVEDVWLVAWEQGEGRRGAAPYSLWARSLAGPSLAPGAPVQISFGQGPQHSPQIAVAGDTRQALIVWDDYRSSGQPDTYGQLVTWRSQ